MNEPEMMLEDALAVLKEIATGDKEQVAYKEVEHAVGAYRSLYEGTMKKLERYRDVSAKPDVFVPTFNKDRFSELAAARREYDMVASDVGTIKLPFEEWLFEKVVSYNPEKQ